ncbi:class I SAM-dependent methyltransferase [Limisalsivibrio acetivorans]|uniref:class I SAM-dependent methyltransferase n=1 Tax=Limisalsivibrio acetivorans TaxID=1304888 RepID=UPI0003B631D6|nr:class I SAM-dependent methyltransferase [Limisalsivibrio acetivorans]
MKSEFDKKAREWDKKERRVRVAKEIAASILERTKVPEGADILDYGTGTGLVLLSFAGRGGTLTGVDTSDEMLKVLREKAEEDEITNLSTAVIDIESARFPGEYDLITASMVMHHMDKPYLLVKEAEEALRPGGFFAAADLEEEDGSFHDASHSVKYAGFSKEAMQSMFHDAGLIDIKSEKVTEIVKEKDGEEKSYSVLLTIGCKP